MPRKTAPARPDPSAPWVIDTRDLGRRAGAIRNQEMIDEGKADGVVAFPGGKGTEDLVRRAEAAGLTVWRPCA